MKLKKINNSIKNLKFLLLINNNKINKVKISQINKIKISQINKIKINQINKIKINQINKIKKSIQKIF